MKTTKKLLIFQETEFSKILGKENPKKLLISWEVTFWSRKKKRKSLLKSLLYLGRWNFQAPS